MNRNLSTTTPDRAAEIIVRGIKKRKPRIIVGPDNRVLSLIQRLFPKRDFSIANKLTGGKLSETQGFKIQDSRSRRPLDPSRSKIGYSNRLIAVS